MFGFFKKIYLSDYYLALLGLLATRNVSLSNQKCVTEPTIINLHPNVYTQGLCYYPFVFNLDVSEVVILLMTCLKRYVFQAKQDLNIIVFKMITGINELKTLPKHISYECKCKFDGRKCN